jgi:hypothetical protein
MSGDDPLLAAAAEAASSAIAYHWKINQLVKLNICKFSA